MVIASKACLLNPLEIPSISPLTEDIIKKTSHTKPQATADDPLSKWLTFEGIQQFRSLEKAIKKLLIEQQYHDIIVSLQKGENGLSSLACFYYVGLFRLLKSIIQSFYSSNPTWVKIAKDDTKRINISKMFLIDAFRKEIDSMVQEMSHNALSNKITASRTDFAVASSESLPWQSSSIDLIITSPPYCTRIDYAVATMPELSILGLGFDNKYDELRRNLIGTTTVPKNNIDVSDAWGSTCLNFLDQIYQHKSKASKSYYFKSHTQYFRSIFNSIIEIKRVLTTGGKFVAVLQDSFYKEIHNDLPKIFTDMASNNNLSVTNQIDFTTTKSMSGINNKIKRYRSDYMFTESVVFFEKI